MTTLADELLADLADDEEGLNNHEQQAISLDQGTTSGALELRRKSLKDVTLLWMSTELEDTMEKIKQLVNGNVSKDGMSVEPQMNSEQGEDEAKLVTRVNSMAFDIDDEIAAVFKCVKDIYHKRFPEMESLILDPLYYVRTVQLLRNDINAKKYEADLRTFLKPATVMVLTVSSSTTKSDPLSPQELDEVLQGCRCIMDLHTHRNTIVDYVQSRMTIIAPNSSAIVGPRTAAQLIGTAGGLSNLSRIPACNLPMLGSTKANLIGLSSANPDIRNGYLYQCDLVASVPLEFRTRAVRVISGKLSLTSRIDAGKEYADGSMGRQFRKFIDDKLDAWQEPPPTRDVKALEAPDDKPRRRRGGKRQRKLNEKMAMTEMQKQANRVSFGVAEEEVMFFDETEGLGMLSGKSSDQVGAAGKIRASAVDPRAGAKPQRLTKSINGQQSSLGLASSITRPSSGLSSLVFTPVQGMELVDPEAQKRKLKDVNDKWFASTAKFRKVEQPPPSK